MEDVGDGDGPAESEDDAVLGVEGNGAAGVEVLDESDAATAAPVAADIVPPPSKDADDPVAELSALAAVEGAGSEVEDEEAAAALVSALASPPSPGVVAEVSLDSPLLANAGGS